MPDTSKIASHPDVLLVEAALRAAGIEPKVVAPPEPAPTATAAAAQIGCEVGAIANSLIFDADGAPLPVLTSGAHRVDPEKVARTAGVSALKRAAPDFVRTHTGQAIGGVAPLGHPAPVRTLIDRTLAAFPEIWAAAGLSHMVFPCTYEQLTDATKALAVDVN
jgi:prolyl-tRNA editing enzyme YbaK/EbsC (Cys-tRNA(Pro) deacylase)